MTGPVTLVVGAGGLLGGALVRRLRRDGAAVLTAENVPWGDATGTHAALGAALARAAVHPGGWQLAWCAGAGVTGTAQSVLDQEVDVFADFLHLVTSRPPRALFLASSAGGVYAGSAGAPFTERHEPVPLAPYGVAKLAMEQAAREFAARTGVPTVIGRISNLYGPGQNLGKAQGLISYLCRAHLTGAPLSVYVPLDTIRDYLFVDDAAAMVATALDTVTAALPGLVGGGPPAVVKIMASQRGTTIGALIGECTLVFKRRVRVVHATSAVAKFQAGDLRLRSVIWSELDREASTTLAAGIAATAGSLTLACQAGQL